MSLLDDIKELNESEEERSGASMTLKKVFATYCYEEYEKIWEYCKANKELKSFSKTIYKMMVHKGIVTETKIDSTRVIREFADKSLGYTCGNGVRVYKSKAIEFLRLMGIEARQ